MKTTKTIERLKITVKRPSGEIEIVYKDDNVRYIGTIAAVQQNCIEATKKAGKGDIQSFEIIEEQIPMSLTEQRQDLVWDIEGLLGAQDDARERDYDNDIGFHESVKYDSKIKAARNELSDFDTSHPEISAEINRVNAVETARQIQSALNA